MENPGRDGYLACSKPASSEWRSSAVSPKRDSRCYFAPTDRSGERTPWSALSGTSTGAKCECHNFPRARPVGRRVLVSAAVRRSTWCACVAESSPSCSRRWCKTASGTPWNAPRNPRPTPCPYCCRWRKNDSVGPRSTPDRAIPFPWGTRPARWCRKGIFSSASSWCSPGRRGDPVKHNDLLPVRYSKKK